MIEVGLPSYYRFIRNMRSKNAVEIISCLFIALFTYAAVSKLLDYNKFSAQIGQSPILAGYTSLIAVAVPAIELLISGMLIFSNTRLAGLYGSFSLMMTFTVYIILASKFSDFVPCSCGGVLQNLTWSQHLIFNISFLVIGVAGVLLYSPSHDRRETLEHRRP